MIVPGLILGIGCFFSPSYHSNHTAVVVFFFVSFVYVAFCLIVFR